MADINSRGMFDDQSVADRFANRATSDFGTSGSMHEIDWGTEDAYWQENYASRPYARADRGFEHYRPAYRYGAESAMRFRGRSWDDAEPEMLRGWDAARGETGSQWEDVKHAVRDAWDRVTGRGDRR